LLKWRNEGIKTTDNPNDNHLFMNGPAIFNFTAKAVPELIKNTLEKNNESLESMDQFIFIRLILLC
jgi:3-oxoacyl-[acyl-carrier-protein] synthase-3